MRFVDSVRGTGGGVFGIVRPCAHTLGEGLRAQWAAHLCGLCLALRADHGQFARIVTNYDGLLVSVLTEAQAAPDPGQRRTAGPCPLRGMRTASVARGEGARLAAAVSLVLASAKVHDHLADGDGVLARRPVAVAARRVAAGWGAAGARAGSAVGFDTAVLTDAVDRQTGIEALAGPGTSVLTVTEPTETATAAAFAHTARLAGRPGNVAPLAEAGRFFGRLAHLLDAVEDQAADAAAGAWNPLTATDTSLTEARRLADEAVHGIRLALRDAEFTDGRLVHRLLVHELRRSVDRAFGTHACGVHGHGRDPGGSGGAGTAHTVHGVSMAHGAHGLDGADGPGHGTAAAPGPGPQGPYAPWQPQAPAPGNPYGDDPHGDDPHGDDPHGDDPHGGGRPPRPGRGFWAACGLALGLGCTCRACCAEEWEGPWSGRRREGCCHKLDCSCCDCCDCCQCCGGDGGDGGCCGCDGCDCGCDC